METPLQTDEAAQSSYSSLLKTLLQSQVLGTISPIRDSVFLDLNLVKLDC